MGRTGLVRKRALLDNQPSRKDHRFSDLRLTLPDFRIRVLPVKFQAWFGRAGSDTGVDRERGGGREKDFCWSKQWPVWR
jgi:hypothetical protein